MASLHTGILIIIDKYHLKCLKQVLFDSKAFKIKFCEAHAKDQALEGARARAYIKPIEISCALCKQSYKQFSKI